MLMFWGVAIEYNEQSRENIEIGSFCYIGCVGVTNLNLRGQRKAMHSSLEIYIACNGFCILLITYICISAVQYWVKLRWNRQAIV